MLNFLDWTCDVSYFSHISWRFVFLSSFLGDTVSQFLKFKNFSIFNSETFSHSPVILFWIPCSYFVSVASFPRLSGIIGVFPCALHGVHTLHVPSVCHLFVGFGICPPVVNFPRGLVMLCSLTLRRKVSGHLGAFCALWGRKTNGPHWWAAQVGGRLFPWMLQAELCLPPNSYVEVLTPSTSECDCVWR